MLPDGRARPCSHRSCPGRLSNGRVEEICPWSTTAAADHFLEHVASEECDVGRTFREASHEIRIPLRAEGNVDAHSIPFAYKPVLEVAADAVQHLELVAVGRDPM